MYRARKIDVARIPSPWFDAKHSRVIVYILNDVVVGRNKSEEQRLLEGRGEKGLRAAGVQFFFCTRIQTGICSLSRLHSTPWGVAQDFVGPRDASVPFHRRFLSCHSSSKEFAFFYWRKGKERFWILSFENIYNNIFLKYIYRWYILKRKSLFVLRNVIFINSYIFSPREIYSLSLYTRNEKIVIFVRKLCYYFA